MCPGRTRMQPRVAWPRVVPAFGQRSTAGARSYRTLVRVPDIFHRGRKQAPGDMKDVQQVSDRAKGQTQALLAPKRMLGMPGFSAARSLVRERQTCLMEKRKPMVAPQDAREEGKLLAQLSEAAGATCSGSGRTNTSNEGLCLHPTHP